MKSAEKARELYEKFVKVDGVVDEVLPHTIAKSCALICVREILNEQVRVDYLTEAAYEELKIYWQSVKQEIETL